jgi:hypothetical protein
MKNYEDPIVAETREIRRELAMRFGNDIDGLCDFLIDEERQHEDRLVTRAPRPAQVVADFAGRAK